MAALFSSGVTPDGVLSGGITLVSLFVSNVVTLGLALYQNRSHSRAQAATAEKWQAHAEELRDRMERWFRDRLAASDRQHEAEIGRYEARLQRYESTFNRGDSDER